MRLAVTGGTGFVGSHLIAQAVAAGHEVRALTRRPQPEQDGVRWYDGALDRRESLAALVAGCDAVIHIAGVVKGTRAAFRDGNVIGTGNLVAATVDAGIDRFLHISSLAAREPQLSAYGWSKAESEALVAAARFDWTIIRPPAIYGPGDREMFDVFRIARWGLVPIPPGGRVSLIHVADLARLLLAALADQISSKRMYEPDDGCPAGWSTSALARAIGLAVGRRIVPLPIPQRLMRIGATADRLIRGPAATLTPDRVSYFCHPDWTVAAAARPPASLWRPQVETAHGLAETARWYADAGWYS